MSGLTFSSAPPDRISAQDENYDFPRLDVCVWGGQGCDDSLSSSQCIGTAAFTVYDPCDNETTGANITSQVRAYLFVWF